MNKKTLSFIIAIGIISILIIIQSVTYPLIMKLDFIPEFSLPDISLIAIVYFSINYGKILGETMGFTTGLILDSLSGAPFGINALLRLVIGYFLGFFNGKVFLDKFILPVIIIAITTFIKYVLYHVISFIYPVEISIHIISISFLEELLLNVLLTPFLFLLFNIIVRKIIRD